MRDLVIGLALGYTWEQLEPFVVSLIRSGFEGDKVLFVHRLADEIADKLTRLGFKLLAIPGFPYSDPTLPEGKFFPYIGRFLLFYEFLREYPNYRYVICSDTRDVVFQSDPIKWIESHLFSYKHIIAASEHILHKDQSGNMSWIEQGFKEVQHALLDRPIYCSGFISGDAEYIRDLCLSIYLGGRQLSKTIWGVDQPIYNSLMHTKPYQDITFVPKMADQYCVNLCVVSMTQSRALMTDTPPIAKIDDHGMGLISDRQLLWNYGIPDLGGFAVLHQYDRIVPLAEILKKRYSLDSPEASPLHFEPTKF